MGNVKNLSSGEAAQKVKEFAEDIGTCMFCTYDGYKLVSRPMGIQQADAEGNLWFLSDKDSNKNRQIAANSNLELLFAQTHDKFLAIHGKAEISYDREKIKELWKPLAKTWFTEGVDDPRISVIKVKFDDGHYWSNKHGTMVAFAKMAVGAIMGKTMDDGVEGKLKN